MPTLNKPKCRKLVFDYTQYEGQQASALLLSVHKALLARINKLLEMFSKRVVQYRFSVRVDIARLELEITEPVHVRITWVLHSTGDFDMSLVVRDYIYCDHVHIPSLHEDVAYVDSKVVYGSDRYQATAFAKVLSSVLADIASLERGHTLQIHAVTGKLTAMARANVPSNKTTKE